MSDLPRCQSRGHRGIQFATEIAIFCIGKAVQEKQPTESSHILEGLEDATDPALG